MGIVVAIGYAFRWSSGGVRLQPLAFCWVVQVLRSLWFRTCITFFVSDLLFALNSWNACILSCVLFIPALTWLPESHTGLFSRHGSPLDLYVLWRSKKQVKILCPTRFVVDATENRKEGRVSAEVYSFQTGLWTNSKIQILLLLPRSHSWSHFRRGNLWTSSNQHHPPPSNISWWSDARQCKTIARWMDGFRSVGASHQVKKNSIPEKWL